MRSGDKVWLVELGRQGAPGAITQGVFSTEEKAVDFAWHLARTNGMERFHVPGEIMWKNGADFLMVQSRTLDED